MCRELAQDLAITRPFVQQTCAGPPRKKSVHVLSSRSIYWPLVSRERRNGKENGNYYNGLFRDYGKDPFLHSQLTHLETRVEFRAHGPKQ